jgi:hypothetical protein
VSYSIRSFAAAKTYGFNNMISIIWQCLKVASGEYSFASFAAAYCCLVVVQPRHVASGLHCDQHDMAMLEAGIRWVTALLHLQQHIAAL